MRAEKSFSPTTANVRPGIVAMSSRVSAIFVACFKNGVVAPLSISSMIFAKYLLLFRIPLATSTTAAPTVLVLTPCGVGDAATV